MVLELTPCQTQGGAESLNWRIKMSTPRQKAKILNDHHMQFMAGFYPDSGGRCFSARVHKGVLEVSPDFGKSWVDATNMTFHNFNGRPIDLGE